MRKKWPNWKKIGWNWKWRWKNEWGGIDKAGSISTDIVNELNLVLVQIILYLPKATRYPFGCFIAGISEHESLIARTDLIIGLIDALIDVNGFTIKSDSYFTIIGINAIFLAGVANIADGTGVLSFQR